MPVFLSPTVDLHVHSTFSDGRDTVETNARVAADRGLSVLGCVDHVRLDSDWVPRFVAEVERVRSLTRVRLLCGVEAKILDASGRLDLPSRLDGVERVFIADHQFPLPEGCVPPAEIRRRLAEGSLDAALALRLLTIATVAAMRRTPHSVLAHLFSVLPKIGLDEAEVPDALLRRLAWVARDTGAWMEVDERWRCPSARTVHAFAAAGVPIYASSDSHRADTIGRYSYIAETFQLGVAAS